MRNFIIAKEHIIYIKNNSHYKVKFFIGEDSAKAMTISPPEKVSTIQYGYRKHGTQARLYSQTLVHENGKMK